MYDDLVRFDGIRTITLDDYVKLPFSGYEKEFYIGLLMRKKFATIPKVGDYE